MNDDVRRGRALVVAAAVAALGTVVLLLIFEGPSAVVSPGPLSPLHVRAGVGCADCHSEAEKWLGVRDVPRGSGRLAARAIESSAVEPSSPAWIVTAHTAPNPSVSAAKVEGPRVPARREAALRVVSPLERSRDPAFHCFSSRTPYSLCFDEHERPRSVEPVRAAAAEKARAEVLLSLAGPAGPEGALAAFLATALGVVGFVIAGRRRRMKRQSSTKAPPEAASRRRLPLIDAKRCLGCSACVEACPHDVLEVERFVAVVARPDACCGLVLCAERCPNGSLTIAFGEPIAEQVRLGPELESLEQPGAFLAGDVAGSSLIRNAVEQENAQRALLTLRSIESADVAAGSTPISW